MSPGRIQSTVAAAKTDWVRRMVGSIRALPLSDSDRFLADPRNPAAAESYLRRALEALLDLGRHILAKGFGEAAGEYRQVAELLARQGVLSGDAGSLLSRLAGYRNRMVHLYNEVGQEELRLICLERLADVEQVLGELLSWLASHPDQVDDSL